MSKPIPSTRTGGPEPGKPSRHPDLPTPEVPLPGPPPGVDPPTTPPMPETPPDSPYEVPEPGEPQVPEQEPPIRDGD